MAFINKKKSFFFLAKIPRRGVGIGNRNIVKRMCDEISRAGKTSSIRRNHTAGGSKPTANTITTTASLTSQENSSFMSNVMLPSPLNDDGSNSLTSTPTVAMETDQIFSTSHDLPKEVQQRQNGKFKRRYFF